MNDKMKKGTKKVIVSKKNYDKIEKARKETQENFPDSKITHDDVVESLLWD